MNESLPTEVPMADDAAPVLSHRDGAVQTLTLNRPQALNSFNGAMHDALMRRH